MNSQVLLITGLIITAIVLFQLYRRAGSNVLSRQKSGNQALLGQLIEEASVLNSSVEVFSELSEEYFISISSNGFEELCKINEALKAAIELCKSLEKANQIGRRDELLRYLQVERGKGLSPGFLFQTMREDLIQNLSNWDDRLAEILLKITEGIRSSSSGFKNVGRSRSSKRHNTTRLLNELVGMVRR